jgi:hypothetical protein
VTTAPDSGGRVAATLPAPLPAVESIDFDEAYAALDESPGMYLWLASSDASAMLDSNLPDATDGAGNGVTR